MDDLLPSWILLAMLQGGAIAMPKGRSVIPGRTEARARKSMSTNPMAARRTADLTLRWERDLELHRQTP
ncbi:MAG: hypothetical protein P4L80_19590 [Xanthobacteraceae bacterium]|nr:hypothetical protein [Xanthobacteraceae bacterium]